MKYYWLLEVNPIDWDATNTLIEKGCTHVATNMMGDSHIRLFIKNISEQERTLLTLSLGDKVSIWPVSLNEEIDLRNRGYICN